MTARGLVGAALLLVVVVEGSAMAAEPRAPLQFIAARAVLQLQQGVRPPLIVDVRTPEEFEAVHIRGALNIPLRELSHRYREIPREGLVVLY